MGLFFDVLSAINNPEQEASVDQLSNVMSTIQGLARQNGIDDSTMQTLVSKLGELLRPTLKNEGLGANSSALSSTLGSLAGGGGVNSLLTSSLTSQFVEKLSRKTGLNEEMLRGIIPVLVPAVLSLLNMGKTKPGVPGGNPLLNSFLDGDKDGDVDLGDVFQLAGRFLRTPT